MTTIKTRRGTAVQWMYVNPVLAEGERGIETDTGKEKSGNGISTWSELFYMSDPLYLAYNPAGLDLSGSIDISDKLIAAANAGQRVHLKKPNSPYIVTKEIGITGIPGGDNIFTADEGTEILRMHTGRGIYQIPTPVVSSFPIDTAVIFDTHVQATVNPSWDVDQWVGCDVQISFLGTASLPAYDSTLTYQQGDQVKFGSPLVPYQSEIDNNVGNTPAPTSLLWTRLVSQTHTITGNSSDGRIEFEHGIGATIGSGSTAIIMRPMKNTVMHKWKMICPFGGQAGVVLNWPGYIDLEYSVEGTTGGNPSTVYHAKGGSAQLRAQGGSIMCFFYNPDGVTVTADMEGVDGVLNYHGLQIKDGRNCTSVDIKGKNLERVYDSKCSGLHATFGNTARGIVGHNITSIAADLYTLLNEGKGHALYDCTIDDVKTFDSYTTVRISDQNDPAVGPRSSGLRIGTWAAYNALSAPLVLAAPNARVGKGLVVGCGPYPISLVGADDSETEEIQLFSVNKTSNTELIRTTNTLRAVVRVRAELGASDNTRRYVNELGTSNQNIYLIVPRGYTNIITSDGTLQGTSVIRKGREYYVATKMVHAARDMAVDRAYTIDRLSATISNSGGLGTPYVAAFTALTDLLVSQIRMQTGSANKVGTATLARMGLYSVDDSNILTLIARTANDTTLFDTLDAMNTRNFAATTLAATAATDDTLSAVAHGLVANQQVNFLTVVSGLSVLIPYYVTTVTADTFKVSASVGGAAVDITAAGSVSIQVFPSTFQLIAGKRYAAGPLVVGGTSYTFRGASMQQTLALDGAVKGGRLGSTGASTDLPVTPTGVSNAALIPWVALLQ